MIKIKGVLNNKGEIVFRSGKQFLSDTLYQETEPGLPIEIIIEVSVTIGLNNLISGIDGIVWATKNICQADIIINALKVQNIEAEIVNTENDNGGLYFIKVFREEDIKTVIEFIQNDSSGLRLKPDWNYPDGEPNQSFEQWINE
jgi:hypothetical protein